MDMNGKICNLAALSHFIKLLYICIFTIKTLDLSNYKLQYHNTCAYCQTVTILKYLSI